MHGIADAYAKQKQQQQQQQQPQQSAKTQTVKGLIVQPLSPPLRVAEFDQNGHPVQLRHVFQATVFHLPDHPANNAVKSVLKDGVEISVSTRMTADDIAQATLFPGTITFDNLDVTLPPPPPPSARMAHHTDNTIKAIDPRQACQIQGTPAFNAHTNATQGQMMGKSNITSPCDTCVCKNDTSKPTPKHRSANPF